MKILMLSHSGSVTGGAEQCMLEYIDVLVKEGHQFGVVIPNDDGLKNALLKRNIKPKIIGYGWSTRPHKKVNPHIMLRSNGNALTRIFQYAQSFKPDVIMTNTAVIPWGLYVAKSLNIPTILLVHEILNDKDPSLRMLPSHDRYMEILNDNADYVLYNSKFVKGEYSSNLTKPHTSKEILYPLPPLDREKIDHYFKENAFEQKTKMMIIGAVSERKNQFEALEAAKLLKQKGISNFEIDIYGDNITNFRYVKKLKDYISENDLTDVIKLKGYTAAPYEEINKHNVLLNTATYEPFGRTIVEGQFFGRVVISNETGGGSELVEDGKTGLVYESGNSKKLAEKMEWVILHNDKAVKLGSNAKTIQTKRFIKDSRYKPLLDSISFVSNINSEVDADSNIQDPVLSLIEYNHYLNNKYKSFERLFNNRATRLAKSVVRRTEAKAKKVIKKIITKI